MYQATVADVQRVALPCESCDKIESLQQCGPPAEACPCLQCGLDVDQVGLNQGLQLTQCNLDRGERGGDEGEPCVDKM
jgi:hypothetical protein